MDKPIKGINVDGGTRGNPGECFYRGKDLETGEILFSEELGMGTNNIAEFLAVVHAIHYVRKHKIVTPIYTDSVTAMAWVRKMEVNTRFEGDVTPRLNKACDYLKKIIPPQILKWETKQWGEIPADYGRK